MQALDIITGLIVVYVSLSIVCTAVNELIAGWLNLRAAHLKECIDSFMGSSDEESVENDFFAHAIIQSLCRRKGPEKKRYPSYISSHTFSIVLMDILRTRAKESGAGSSPEMDTMITALGEKSELKSILRVLWEESGGDLKKFKAGLESWYDNIMGRVAGWYKRKMQIITLCVAIVIVAATNADTIQIIKSMSNDPALRNTLVSQAKVLVSEKSGQVSVDSGRVPEGASPALQQINARLGSLGLPLGWHRDRDHKRDGIENLVLEIINKIAGLFITVFAVSLGAPFWFDILNRLMNLRAAGTREDTEKDSRKQ